MNKIRIMRIITRMNIGGPAVHVSLLNKLNNENYFTRLYSGVVESNEDEFGYESQEILKIPSLSRGINFRNDFETIRIIINEIRRISPDIIHTHLSKAGVVGRIAGIIYNFTHKRKTILIHTYHGMVFEHYFGFFKSKLYLYIERFLALFTDKIIAISESQKQDLIKYGFNEKKIEVIKLGIDLKLFLHERRFESKNVLKIGIIGRLEPIKNHKMFLDAIKRIKDFGSDQKFLFYIIGDGSLRDELERYAVSLDILDYVDFIGNKNREKLAEYYNFLDCVVSTSLNEGTPVSLIEAMASECLVIATDVGGTKDLMGNSQVTFLNGTKYCDNGYLMGSDNYKQLTSLLNYFSLLYDTIYVQSRIKNAKQFVKDNYSKERLLADINNLYIRLME